MIGVAIGDIAGSIYEFIGMRDKNFPFMSERCEFTDDTVMGVAVAKAVMDYKDGVDKSEEALRQAVIREMRHFGKLYPDPMGGYGGRFAQWLASDNPQPYNSWGNGSAMRVAACGFAAEDMDEAMMMARVVSEVTHNHPEAIQGAQVVAGCIHMAKCMAYKEEIRQWAESVYGPFDFTVDELRKTYTFTERCSETVPPAIMAFLESEGFEDAVRNAVSIGGDADTLAAITGGIAEAYYGVPVDLRNKARTFLDNRLMGVMDKFERRFG